jgi:thymidylate synthase ThyX
MRTSYLDLLTRDPGSQAAAWPFESSRPKIRLVKAFETPFSNVVATARTCYSSKGIVPDQTPLDERFVELAQDLYQAGHHTTFQHAHFQFSMENVSRQFLWSFLHSHPFYNSEQVSQRYVPVKTEQFVVPHLDDKCREIYRATAEMQMEAYKALCAKLSPVVKAEYFKRFRIRGEGSEKHQKNIKKKAMEMGRYVLPVATFAYLYHTISGITLLRYARVCNQLDTPSEQREVVRQMIEALLVCDPGYEAVLQNPMPISEMPETAWCGNIDASTQSQARRFIAEFDGRMKGEFSTLAGWGAEAEILLADAVREVIGKPRTEMSDNDAIDLALSPERNPILGEALNLTTHSKLSRALFHPHYTFRKRISHTADSQDQRHRMTPASRPALAAHYTGEPDYIRPEIFNLNAECSDFYEETMRKTWKGINDLLDHGAGAESALYLLPNAVAIRFTESSDLLNLRHKHAMRLCYNAQEEIWRASVEEASQIREIQPRIGRYLLPPCGHRELSGSKPFCPEGDRYCGIPVWKLDLEEYVRVI